jgi:two-component system sensor histidine kinase HupT/HoxJ
MAERKKKGPRPARRSLDPALTAATPAEGDGPAAVGEHVWIDVIRRMDEVYSDLLQYEVALEQKNGALEETQRFVLSVLTSMSDILVVCTRSGAIEDVNQSFLTFTGRTEADLRGSSVLDLAADRSARQAFERVLADAGREPVHDLELQLLGSRRCVMVVHSC